jgi:iron complex outermembrane receptor protein
MGFALGEARDRIVLNGARAYALAAMLLGAPLDVWMGTAARAEETQTARVEEEDARPESGGGAARVEEIVVWGSPLTPFRVDAELAPLAETNTALLLRRIAGASVNFNGTLAGIAQYRGMSGERVNIDLDGMAVGNACSNHMDAPLHYLPRTFVDRIEVERGIASVSSGMETIGGTVVARSRSGEFGSDDALEGSGQLVLAGQSVDRGYAASGDFAVANERHRLRAAASREQGDARRFPGGRIRATRYERNAFDLGYGLRRGEASWSVDYRRNDTGLTGTPALPMDDVFSDANLLRSSFSGQRGAALLSAELYWNGIDHLMSNYRMRPVGSMRRDSRSDAQTLGWRVEAERELAGGEARAGVDGRLFDYDARVRNPDDAAFFVRTFDDVERDRYGVYAEWERGDLGPWALELGLRFTRVTMHADRVDASMAMMAPALATLRDRFNAAERTLRDDHLDATGVVTFALSDALRIEAGAARKMRSPTHQERFLWLPIEASGGLSDGNVYVGDLRLDPETAWQAELGLDWRSQRLQLAPRAFYHHVENYIQGVPSTDPAVLMVGAMNGDPTPLSFANVGARLYGVDVEWAATISPRWQLQGILSWVRGERRDVDDDLFRIAPFNARVDLSYQREQWSVTLEAEAAAAQDHVSLTNGETRSSGYGVVNLYGQYVWRDSGFRLTAGVENLFDATYRPHLNGINRVTQSDVAVGDRLPGDGVNGFVQLGWQF